MKARIELGMVDAEAILAEAEAAEAKQDGEEQDEEEEETDRVIGEERRSRPA